MVHVTSVNPLKSSSYMMKFCVYFFPSQPLLLYVLCHAAFSFRSHCAVFLWSANQFMRQQSSSTCVHAQVPVSCGRDEAEPQDHPPVSQQDA